MANLRINCSQIPNSIAVSAVNSLRGRWFAGKVITAAYIPAEGYFAVAFRDISEAIETSSLRVMKWAAQFRPTCNYEYELNRCPIMK